jgi:hypothetical protein
MRGKHFVRQRNRGLGWAPTGAGLLILAGPDRDQLQHWVDAGRQRAGRARLQARGPSSAPD